jgi:hypothetical protein
MQSNVTAAVSLSKSAGSSADEKKCETERLASRWLTIRSDPSATPHFARANTKEPERDAKHVAFLSPSPTVDHDARRSHSQRASLSFALRTSPSASTTGLDIDEV